MSGYENFTDTDHVFYDMSVKQMKEAVENKETFVVYFGFSSCPYCNIAMPILNEVAKENDAFIFYINTRKNPSWTSNLDIDDYDYVVEYLRDYLSYDDNGKLHLYTPHVTFIKDGVIVKDHEGVVGQDNTEQDREQLKQIYEEGFQELE